MANANIEGKKRFSNVDELISFLVSFFASKGEMTSKYIRECTSVSSNKHSELVEELRGFNFSYYNAERAIEAIVPLVSKALDNIIKKEELHTLSKQRSYNLIFFDKNTEKRVREEVLSNLRDDDKPYLDTLVSYTHFYMR